MTIGSIAGTDLTVTQFAPGIIEFTLNKPLTNGQAWSGVINTLRFKSKITGQSVIRYNIKNTP